jgi:hypothetical protein
MVVLDIMVACLMVIGLIILGCLVFLCARLEEIAAFLQSPLFGQTSPPRVKMPWEGDESTFNVIRRQCDDQM